MIRDPLYRAIEDRLGGDLDPDLFEQCATELLRSVYPGLTPVRGGGDAGMDGSIPATDAPPLPLICTTAENVIGNLTRSLKSYLSEGGESRLAVLATSESLTPRRRRNLDVRARELGFTLRNIHARDDFVGRLYHAPTWRKELLGLSGNPPALSALPRSRRPFSTHPLIGREEDLDWIRSRTGDCLLIGQPGSGKTAILASLALADEGAFLVSESRGEIAEAVREHAPRRIFVDDAQRRQEVVVELSALRAEIGADFKILTTCWPAEGAEIQRSLGLGPNDVRRLPLLPRAEVAEIVKAVGIAGPDALIAEILDQAAGLPGLAVTLAQLSIRVGTVELASGEFLLRDVKMTLRDLVGERAIPILAAFSIGGRSGFSLDAVARALEQSPMDLWNTITRIDSGGVVKEVSQGSLVVEPPALREALVREVFFSGSTDLPATELLDMTTSPAHTAETLIQSRRRGAVVSDQLIRDLLARCVPDGRWTGQEQRRAWLLYAYSGPGAVEWILDQFPELLHVVARPALIHCPNRAVPKLLNAAVDDERDLHPHPDHPLRLIQDWIKAGRPGSGEALDRRRALLDALLVWSRRAEATPRVVRLAVSIAFTPEFKDSPGDRIDPRKFVIRMGHVTEEELQRLQEWWPEAVTILERVGVDDITDMEGTVRQWAYPGMLHASVSDRLTAVAKTGASRMLEDLARLGQGYPGVVAWAARLANRVGLDIPLSEPLDPVYEVLFPPEDYGEKWKARNERYQEAARDLAVGWADEAPADVATVLVRYDREATRTRRSWPRLTNVAAIALAERVDQPGRWIEALVTERAQPDLVAPFLWRVLELGGDVAETLWLRLFGDEAYRWLCIDHALRNSGTSETMLERTYENLESAAELVRSACTRSEVPRPRVVRLLEHPSSGVAAAAAEGVWYSGEKDGSIPAELHPAWRNSVIRNGCANYILRDAFRDDPELAESWLLARRKEDSIHGLREDEPFAYAAEVLDPDTRRKLLATLDPEFGPAGFFGMLVGTDPDLFDVLLTRPEMKPVHMEPLVGHPGGSWNELAMRALNSGYTAAEIAGAVYGLSWSWTGNESSMWEGWANSFRSLMDHEDERLREIGRIGRERAESEAAAARERERQEEVYGFG